MGKALVAKQSAATRERARKLAARGRRAFRSDADMLKAARTVFALREGMGEETDVAVFRESERILRAAKKSLHASIDATPKRLHLAAVLRGGKLSRVEREVVLVLCLSALAMVDRVNDIEDLMRALGQDGADGPEIMRALSPTSPIVTRELVDIDDDDDEFSAASIYPTVELVEPLIVGKRRARARWNIKSYDRLLDRVGVVFAALRSVSEADMHFGGRYRPGRVRPPGARANRLLKEMRRAAELRPDWPLNEVFQSGLQGPEIKILILLVGKELGFRPDDHAVYCGEWLARCAAGDIEDIRRTVRLLWRKAPLRARGLVTTTGTGPRGVSQEDDATLRSTEFELTKEFRERLRVKRQQTTRGKSRRPVVRMSNLVLHDGARTALSMVAAQAEHSKVLFDDWGLGRRIAYGRGVTALFYGPPGTGKTASAEATAHRLGRTILVANYAEIQNCWVGETEKNIARIFREAQREEAVLFWDEADAMFYDRDDASRTWEVRDVNVLLQEIERFEGLCILSTNRHVTLDKAFERRVSLKIEFAPPDRAMRVEIWRRLLPRKMPLERDVRVADLAAHELTGGEIKNVVMNAARLAVCRGEDATVTRADFEGAMRMELEGRWSGGGGRMGFQRGAET